MLFYVTDDDRAGEETERLIRTAGFEPVKAGGVGQSRVMTDVTSSRWHPAVAPTPAAEHARDMNTTPGNGPSARMKASDADRDAVLADLSEHFQAGRLTADELDDRTGRALTARTWGELADLMRDLPASPAGPASPRVAVTAAAGALPQRPPGRTVLVPVAVLAGIAITVAMSAGTGHARWGILWLVIPVLLIARRRICVAAADRRQ